MTKPKTVEARMVGAKMAGEKMGRAGKGTGRCPVCGQPAVPGSQPFCSTRCAEVDLGRWLKGLYRIPSEEAPDPGEPWPPEDE